MYNANTTNVKVRKCIKSLCIIAEIVLLSVKTVVRLNVHTMQFKKKVKPSARYLYTFCFVLVLVSLIFGQPSRVLIIYPDVDPYITIKTNLEARLQKNYSVQSVVPQKIVDVRDLFKNDSSEFVVVIGQKLIELWKVLHKQYLQKNGSSIFIGSEYDEHIISNNLNNNCTILYRTDLGQYCNSTFNLTGKIPKRIGYIYSYRNINAVQAFKKDCLRLNLSLFPYAVSASDVETSIKSIVKKMVDINNIDLLIIPDDPLVINSENKKTVWDSLLNHTTLPVAIPQKLLSDGTWKNNVFSLKQDYSEIARYAANLIENAQEKKQFIVRNEYRMYKSICAVPKNKIDKSEEHAENILAENFNEKPVQSSHIVNESIRMPSPSARSISPEIGDSQNGLSKKATLKLSNNQEFKKNPSSIKKISSSKHDEHSKVKTSNNRYTKKSNDFKVTDRQITNNNGIQNGLLSNISVTEDPVPEEIRAGKIHSSDPFRLSIWLTGGFIFILSIAFIIVFRSKIIKPSHNGKTCLLIVDKHKRIKGPSNNGKSIMIKQFIANSGYNVKVLKNPHLLNEYLKKFDIQFVIIDYCIDHFIRSILLQTLMDGSLSVQSTLIFYNVNNIEEIKKDFSFVHKTFVFNRNFSISDLNKVLLLNSITEKGSSQPSNLVESYLQGVFHKDSLFDILQMIENSKKTGCLLVENNECSGMIFFEQGFIIYAISNFLIAEEAVFNILSLKTGNFHFISDKKPISRQIQLNVQNVILEHARIEDETKQYAFALSANHA